MSREVTSSCARVVALFAIVRFFSIMGKHVGLECTSLCAGIVALCAVERLLSTVNQRVHFQISSTDG